MSDGKLFHDEYYYTRYYIIDKVCKLVNIMSVSLFVPSFYCCIFLLLFATLW